MERNQQKSEHEDRPLSPSVKDEIRRVYNAEKRLGLALHRLTLAKAVDLPHALLVHIERLRYALDYAGLRGFLDESTEQPLPLEDNDLLAIASAVASMPDHDLRERYHRLVDKRADPGLTALEQLELERIEIRLDAEERDPHIEARDHQWDAERTELMESVEKLLTKLRE